MRLASDFTAALLRLKNNAVEGNRFEVMLGLKYFLPGDRVGVTEDAAAPVGADEDAVAEDGDERGVRVWRSTERSSRQQQQLRDPNKFVHNEPYLRNVRERQSSSLNPG